MKTLYIECNMGAAGDMLMAALLEAAPRPEEFIKKMNLLIPGVAVSSHGAKKCGISGTQMKILINGVEEESGDERVDEEHHSHEHEHEHAYEQGHSHVHYGAEDIYKIIDGLEVSERVRADARAVYGIIAEAEAAAHDTNVDCVHFHEVGALDAVMDVTGVCLLMEQLSPERVVVSPVHVGSGHIHCAHGTLPVPVPATAYILKGVPIYGGEIFGELCTPTGAALLKHFADQFGPMPMMSVNAVGCGMGKKDFSAANMVRVFFGEDSASAGEAVTELVCSLDDITGEELGFAAEELLRGGALDAYVLPAVMKKSRPGHVLVCLCAPAQADGLAELIFKHTGTLGIRRRECARYVLEREMGERQTPFGAVRVKRTQLGQKAEYEDRARLARENGVSVREIK